ncbi:restriction endonuclease subunit S [Thiocapsa bogorovii]|uniref:restriction endonuclease subunit S n=1 Tax=Thiocapsa bogorovii TaxID=521689 RepID=UPI001E5D69AB|nr:restriction endonuclease subunit S [Thiocapsa bogorovii]UHD16820.1 restriction endonuclease subunit S [Thiocapsa bogorovii]
MSAQWESISLGNVATLQRGFDLPHRIRKVGTVPIVTSSGIEDTHSEAKVKAPGVVTGRYGTIGEVFFVRQDFWPLNTTLYVSDFHGNDPLFVSYLLLTIDFHTHSGKSGVPGVNRNDLHTIVVRLPPTKAEQEAIAEALSDADAFVNSLEQLIAKKRQIKQGAMQELLTGRRRLPGFDVEWKIRRLDELGEFRKGSGITREQAQSGPIPCVRYGEIYTKHHDYIKAFRSWISQDVAQTATLLKNGDILFAGSGETKAEIGKCVAFVSDCEAYAGGDLVILRPRAVDALFLGYALNTPSINRQKASRGQGDAVVHISASALGEIRLPLPHQAEQTAIATILSDMDAEITALEDKLAKARRIKQGMMQELLTGRTRLI